MWSGIKDSEGLENKLKQRKQERKIHYQVKLLNCLFRFYGTSAGKLKQNEGLPWWLRRKESACNAGDAGSILESNQSML